jgi:hypothetical protein
MWSQQIISHAMAQEENSEQLLCFNVSQSPCPTYSFSGFYHLHLEKVEWLVSFFFDVFIKAIKMTNQFEHQLLNHGIIACESFSASSIIERTYHNSNLP